jgi:hypothetical protein
MDHVNLGEVKAGDAVCLRAGYRDVIYKYTVERVTKTQVITSGGRYYKQNGRRVGERDAWNYSKIEPWTDDVQKQYTRQRLEAGFASIAGKLAKVPTEQITIAAYKKLVEALELLDNTTNKD